MQVDIEAIETITHVVKKTLFGGKEMLIFGDGAVIERDVLVRILSSASLLAGRAFEWEENSERRRHSTQLRRLTVLHANLHALSELVSGNEVSVSEGDILSITNRGDGLDSPEQRRAPRADISNDLPKDELLARIYQEIKAIKPSVSSETEIDLDRVLAMIRSSGGHTA